MRLINTQSLEFEVFESTENLRYAILSHRWAAEEVLFADLHPPGQLRNKMGFEKLLNFCTRVASRGFTHAWMDTCCIDKSSSAELSEAINSMWHWYSNAEICYVFLADVTVSTVEADFPESEWFERGWTLQELLAPPHLEFYNQRWECLGTKGQLSRPVSARTGIPEIVIQRLKPIQQYCVAERMSWASFRKTTRIEDRAYCLLGIFDVNMPLIYGEAEKAFVRLQEEIIKESNDQTIFEWTERPIDHYTVPSIFPPSGLLATSPHSFRHWHGKKFQVSMPLVQKLFPHAITSCGLQVRFKLLPYKCGIFVAALDYLRTEGDSKEQPCIFLRMLNFQQQFARVVVDRRHLIMLSELDERSVALSLNKQASGMPWQATELFVPQKRTKLHNLATLGLIEPLTCSITLKIVSDAAVGPPHGADIVEGQAEFIWSVRKTPLRLRVEADRPGTLGLVHVLFWISSTIFIHCDILLGFDPQLNFVCIIVQEADAPKWRNSSKTIQDADDVSMKPLQDITCAESKGWCSLDKREQVDGCKIAEQNVNQAGFWALRSEYSSDLNVYLKGGYCSMTAIKRLSSSRLSCNAVLTLNKTYPKNIG